MVTYNANKLNINQTLLTATPHSYQLRKQQAYAELLTDLVCHQIQIGPIKLISKLLRIDYGFTGNRPAYLMNIAPPTALRLQTGHSGYHHINTPRFQLHNNQLKLSY